MSTSEANAAREMRDSRLAVILGSVCRHDNGLADTDWDGDGDGGDFDTACCLRFGQGVSTEHADADVDTYPKHRRRTDTDTGTHGCEHRSRCTSSTILL